MIFDILRCGKPDHNNTIYPLEIVRREVARVQELIRARSFYRSSEPKAPTS